MTKIAFNTVAMSSGTVTVADFTRVCKELCDQLIAAGMTATSDTGQVDFSTMTTMPAQSVVVGYRMFKLNDGVPQAVYLRIRFGTSAYSATRVPWSFWVSIGLGTDGAGNLLNPSAEYGLGSVINQYWPARASAFGLGLQSYICALPGFVGVSFKQLIADPLSNYGPSSGAADSPSLMSFFICRDTDDAGEPTIDGVSLVAVGSGGNYYAFFGNPPQCSHVSATGTVTNSGKIALALGVDAITTVDGKVPLYNIYTMTPKPRRLAQLLIAARAPGAVGNDETAATAVGTTQRNFLVMNPVWPGDIFNGSGTRACIAMLWE